MSEFFFSNIANNFLKRNLDFSRKTLVVTYLRKTFENFKWKYIIDSVNVSIYSSYIKKLFIWKTCVIFINKSWIKFFYWVAFKQIKSFAIHFFHTIKIKIFLREQNICFYIFLTNTLVHIHLPINYKFFTVLLSVTFASSNLLTSTLYFLAFFISASTKLLYLFFLEPPTIVYQMYVELSTNGYIFIFHI